MVGLCGSCTAHREYKRLRDRSRFNLFINFTRRLAVLKMQRPATVARLEVQMSHGSCRIIRGQNDALRKIRVSRYSKLEFALMSQ